MLFLTLLGQILNQLIPVFLVIVTGCALVRSPFFSAKDFEGLERITYHLIFPAVMIMSLVKVKLTTLPFLSIGGALMGGVLVLTLLLLVFRTTLYRRFNISGAAFSSLFQGTVRWNSYTGLALCISLFGERGLVVASIAFLAMIPLLNVLCVLILAKYARGVRVNLRETCFTLLKNPFIWSSLVGVLLSLMQLPLPSILLNYGQILANAAMAMGLLMVGAGLQLETLAHPNPLVLLTCLLKLLLMPLIVGILGYVFHVKGDDFEAMMICACVPTASAAYILAKKFGGDAPLMAQIITFQTLMAIVTMPLILAFCAVYWR